MATSQELTQQKSTADTKGHQQNIFIRPPVDILEDKEGIMVVAEMPGVSKERLVLQTDRNNLLIEGDAAIDMPQGMEAIYADIQSTRYSRSFALSSELNTEAVDAKLKDGVLTIRIPRRSEFLPRKVEVRTD